MEKMRYFWIKSKIYHYLLAAVGIAVVAMLMMISVYLEMGLVMVANQAPSKMVYKEDNPKRRYDIPVYVEIKDISKILFYQKPEQHKGEAFYFEITDTDDNKFIMMVTSKGIQKTIEIKEQINKNRDNADFFVYAVGTTDSLSNGELKAIKEASDSTFSLEQLRTKYGYLLFDLNQNAMKANKGMGTSIMCGTILTILVYYFISSNLKFEASRKSIGYTKQAIVQEWQSVDTKFRVCDVYPGEKVIFSTEGCVLYSDILYVYEGSQKYTEPVIINPGNLVTAELKNGKRVKIGKYLNLYKQYQPLLLPLIAQIKENMAKVQQQ